MTAASVETIVFDLGGVLVELEGVGQMLSWCPPGLSEDELWRRWLSSPNVRRFETGRCSPLEFASAVVDEFALNVGTEEFLAAFAGWPGCLYPGTASLLRSLAPRFKLASLSNTNVLHWRHVHDDLGLGGLCQNHFPSHQIGLLKPDREVFEFVVQHLGGNAERFLFFDDNLINVEAARGAGLHAYRVSGVRQTLATLKALSLIGEDFEPVAGEASAP